MYFISNLIFPKSVIKKSEQEQLLQFERLHSLNLGKHQTL